MIFIRRIVTPCVPRDRLSHARARGQIHSFVTRSFHPSPRDAVRCFCTDLYGSRYSSATSTSVPKQCTQKHGESRSVPTNERSTMHAAAKGHDSSSNGRVQAKYDRAHARTSIGAHPPSIRARIRCRRLSTEFCRSFAQLAIRHCAGRVPAH